jgi:hypothetical protein
MANDYRGRFGNQVRHKIVSVESFTRQREKDFARLHPARIRTHSHDAGLRITLTQFSGAPARNRLQRAWLHSQVDPVQKMLFAENSR